MADYPIDELDGRTPLEAADIPNMDYLARNGLFGLTKTVPDGMSPGSDTANLSIFSYDPARYFTGRAPLEALNMNIELGKNDAAFRCNLVNIEDGRMNDFSADHIDTEFTNIVIGELKKQIDSDEIELYPGVSYRNILVWRNFPYQDFLNTTPPHDITGKEINDFLPRGPGEEKLRAIMEASKSIIAGSDKINKSRERYKGNPNSIWLWGGGKKPAVETLKERFGLHGYTISAVDLINGIGRAAGLTPLSVEGATGYIDTNYSGKADALLEAIKKCNFVFLHVEAPDEAGHEGNIKNKIKAIEDFDKKVVGPVIGGIREYADYTVLVMPDHPTPIRLRTHTADPVPFCLYSSKKLSGFRKSPENICFTEKMAETTGTFIDKAHNLIPIMIDGGI
ncbi:MAG: cofactor-independent phosphoglycerate mutase [Spirochaetes bacterium]|nr:cofactor-independent phosphoglycerate mutase [Spirochaetota bacterium]